MSKSASSISKKLFEIQLMFNGETNCRTVVVAVHHKLPRLIAWEGRYFSQLSHFWYEEVSGTEMGEIRATSEERIAFYQQKFQAEAV